MTAVFAPEYVAGMAELWDARARISKRIPAYADFFWTNAHSAQATAPAIAAYHAELLQKYGSVVDLGCGAGMDTIRFAQAGLDVTAIERDEAAFLFARENARISSLDTRITWVHGDATTANFHANAAYYDPARRDADGTRHSAYITRYEPPVAWARSLLARVQIVVMKLSPALPDAELRDLGGCVRFLSHERECKEACVILTSPDARIVSPDLSPTARHVAALLPENRVFHAGTEAPLSQAAQTWIIDPDAAIVRADALGDLCAQTGASLLSPDDAYLTSPDACDARLGLSYSYRETLPWNPPKVAARLKTLGAGRLVIKKRHGAGDTGTILRDMRWRNGDGAEWTMILVRRGAKPDAVLCQARD